MSEWGPDIPVWSVIWAIFFQGIGSSVAYIPISIMTFSTLSVRLRTEGMAIFHLLANLGTATGTAIVFNLLSRDARVNREVLSAHVTQYNEAFQLPGARELWTLTERSGLAAIEAEIGRQATMIAFNNTLYLTAVIGLAILPLILLLRRSRRGTSTDDEG